MHKNVIETFHFTKMYNIIWQINNTQNNGYLLARRKNKSKHKEKIKTFSIKIEKHIFMEQ